MRNVNAFAVIPVPPLADRPLFAYPDAGPETGRAMIVERKVKMIRMMGVWDVNAWILGAALDGFSGEDWRARPNGANPAIWTLGHLLGGRRHVAREMGFDVPVVETDRHFDMGTNPDDVPADLDPAAMLAEYQDFHGEFKAQLEAMDVATLNEPVENEYPRQPKTRAGALQFMLMHEAYHLGQLGMLRVQLGKGSWMNHGG
jgi:uncharacterized damage-inducible protein DinB